MPDGEALDTVTFTEADGRTTVTLLMELASREGRDLVLNSGMEIGMQEQMDLLEQIVTSMR